MHPGSSLGHEAYLPALRPGRQPWQKLPPRQEILMMSRGGFIYFRCDAMSQCHPHL
jgi:hypothetical protein